MKAGKWIGMALSAAVLLTAWGPAMADGYIKSQEALDKIKIGVTTSQQVTEILGAPANVVKFSRRQVESWDYRLYGTGDVTISIEIDSKGVVSNVQKFVPYRP